MLCEINGLSYRFNKTGITVLQACLLSGLDVPRFCYHEELSIAGNCRMCLVEISFPKTLKPIASCSMPLLDKMVIFTDTTLVKKAREGILEFLLANHPLDCPICDQGGECDLQDQSLHFGSDKGRFYELKRGVEDKECGPFIKTVMTRCIHCTRCVRFAQEISGLSILGTTGRGSSMEIGMFIEKLFHSELSGNVIDLCPVGALTSKPYSFAARPWELRTASSIDISDSLGSRIRMDLRGLEILRILPSLSKGINKEWISDKTRFLYDGLKKQRIANPLIKKDKCFLLSSWEKIFIVLNSLFCFFLYKNNFLNRVKSFFFVEHFLFSFINNIVDLESIIALRSFFFNFNSENLFYPCESILENDFVNHSFLTIELNFLEEKIECLFLIGLNLRYDLPLLNLRLRKNFLKNPNLFIASFSCLTNATYDYLQFRNSLFSFLNFFQGRSFLVKRFLVSKFPYILCGPQLSKDFQISIQKFYTIFYSLKKYIFYENFLSFINKDVGYINYVSIGFSNLLSLEMLKKKIKSPFIFFSNELNFLEKLKKQYDFLIFLGHHGDYLSNFSDIILPASCFTENSASFLNIESKLQRTQFVLFPPGNARNFWKIIFAINNFIYYKNANKVFNNFLKFEDIFIHKYFSSNKEEIFARNFVFNFNKIYYCFPFNRGFVKNNILFNNFIDFFLTDSIGKSSLVLSLASSRFSLYDDNFIVL